MLPNGVQKPKNYEEAKFRYLNGKSIAKISNELSIERHKLSAHLRYDGIQIRQNGQKYQHNTSFFETIDSEIKAYWLGFLYADGEIRSFERHMLRLSLSRKDRDHILKFKNIISPESKISNYKARIRETEYKASRLTIVSKQIIQDLEKLGCTQNKTLTLTFPNNSIVPQQLISHFIRGYFDGDGSIVARTKRNKDGKIPSPCFSLLGTQSFLLSIMTIFCEKLQFTITKLHTKGNIFIYTKSGRNNVQKLYEYLYKDANIYLKRKKDKMFIATLPPLKRIQVQSENDVNSGNPKS